MWLVKTAKMLSLRSGQGQMRVPRFRAEAPPIHDLRDSTPHMQGGKGLLKEMQLLLPARILTAPVSAAVTVTSPFPTPNQSAATAGRVRSGRLGERIATAITDV